MLNSSLRRVARTCPNTGVISRPSTPTSHVPLAATFTTRTHQRRHSSSKPPIPPNNGAPSIPTASVKQVGAPRSDKRPTTDARLAKRKVTKTEKTETEKQEEQISAEWTRTLPSVPSTSHLNPKDVYVASFFSTHRPISITGPLPPEAMLSDIDKIFQPAPRHSRRKPQEVLYTLASAVQSLDHAVSSSETQSHSPQQQQGQVSAAQQEEALVTQRADIIKALTQHNNAATNSSEANSRDGVTHLDNQPNTTSIRVPGNVKLVLQEFARRFRPFNVPPPPVPVPDLEFYAPEQDSAPKDQTATAEGLEAEQARALEIQIQNQDADAEVHHVVLNAPTSDRLESGTFFSSHISRKTHTTGRTGRGTHNAPRRLNVYAAKRRMEVARAALKARQMRMLSDKTGTMQAMSVKRIRKLKMKKHKYKKLQRKTRNLRRRQGKI